MGKVIAIIGQIASGKTTLANFMSENGFEQIATYTTRLRREGEIDGKDYVFLSPEEFAEKAVNGYFAETTAYTTSFGYVSYGTSRKSLETPDGADKVIVLNPEGVQTLKDTGYDIFVVYLDMPQEITMRRALRRGDSPVEIGRRIADDERLFRRLENRDYVNLRVMNPELLPNQIAELIRANL